MALDDNDIRWLNAQFVTREECNRQSAKTAEDIAEMKAEIREMGVKIGHLTKLIATLGSAALVPLVGIAVKIIFGG